MPKLSQIIRAASSYYRPEYAAGLVAMLESTHYSVFRYLERYWTTQDFEARRTWPLHRTARNRALILFVSLGAMLQVLTGIVVLAYNLRVEVPGALPFGIAFIISYPVVWAHLLALAYAAHKLVWSIGHLKQVGRAAVCLVLEWQVRRLRKRHAFILIAVAGSVGKTSTKLAIAHTLETTRRVIYQTGNYNDRVTVPLVLFGQQLPGLFNVPAWLRIFVRNEQTVRRPHFYDCAVVELGTDAPGQLAAFAYLQPDISIVTAVTPEHMEYFVTLDAVADEELAVCAYSKQVLVNRDDTPPAYLRNLQARGGTAPQPVQTYGTTTGVDYRAAGYKPDGLHGGTVTLQLADGVKLKERAAILGEQGVKILLAAAAVGQLAGLTQDELSRGLANVQPYAGRMQILGGVRGSTIIDDTYNASPVAVNAALDVLYATTAPQRIAILGSMNELGEYSQQAHREVGEHCRADKLDVVVTIGHDAEKYLAPAAAKNGCEIQCFTSPYDAGDYVFDRLQDGAVVLAEGSQNRVFAEEALKVLLKSPADVRKLVRQSDSWMRIKQKQFGVPGSRRS